ncbi:MAG: PDZ domain-containing protein [Acidimicrobiia bacterium]
MDTQPPTLPPDPPQGEGSSSLPDPGWAAPVAPRSDASGPDVSGLDGSEPLADPTWPGAPIIVAPKHRKRFWLGWAAFITVIGVPSAVIATTSLQTVPYYVIEPGQATPTEDLISSKDVELYDAKGEVMYTTVRTHRMSRFEKFRYDQGWLSDDVEVVSERQLLGDRTPEENRKENLRVMGFSKDTATFVALRKLGYPAQVTGGGVVVTDIAEEVPAARVLQRGDIITALDGEATPIDADLRAIITKHQPGDVLSATITDNDGTNERTVRIELTKRDDGTPIIGINTGVPPTLQFKFPVDLEIDSGNVGGPSAGLAFTLGALDVLTPGELTGGKSVAVTGTINFSGDVGNIGGIKQKTVAVQRAGADVFIVPADEAADARSAVTNGKLEVVGVETLDDALDELAKLGGNSLALGTPGKA